LKNHEASTFASILTVLTAWFVGYVVKKKNEID